MELLETIHLHFTVTDPEITLEANPKTISKSLGSTGINRLSIGAQSIVDDDLKMLGRIHTAAEAMESVFEMAEIFQNISVDLIYNRPRQKLSHWLGELREVLRWPIQHISLYELIIEEGTKMKDIIDSGILSRPNGDSIFLEETIKTTEGAGFNCYEISNFARPGFECRHSMSYWKYEDYYGVGPGAHSRVRLNGKKIAIAQASEIQEWLTWASGSAILDVEYLSAEEEFQERLIMGLRSAAGLDMGNISPELREKHGIDNKIQSLLANSYIMLRGDNVILTRTGLLKLNLIVKYLSGE
jgi:oxygen-independent coproporphyrinogen-3 oxidase